MSVPSITTPTQTPLVPDLEEPLPRLTAPAGLLAWIASVDHKQIGIMYLLTTFAFFLIGGVEAVLLRLQLAAPGNHVLTPQAYNQLFTMHGTSMIFLVVMPILIGFATYLVPLMIGANDMAFPRLNALSYWLLLFGGLLLYYSFIAGGAPDAGWFAYAPLSSNFDFTANDGMNYWAVGLVTTGMGTIGAAVNLLVTILTMRAPGLTLRRLPLFVWMVMLNSVLLLLALPDLNAGIAMLLFDRLLHAHFFDATYGGQPLLWQHVFWTFGHPEVYIMIVPAWGMISEIIPVFSRRPIFGHGFVAGATVAIVFLSAVVWGHHMFAAGMGQPLDIMFSLSSFLIAVPTGIKVFNWVATTWGGAIRYTTAMLFSLAFVVQFTIGGVTGVMFAAFPVDWQMEDTYFVVAHFHYVLFGGTAFGLFAGTYYWFPKMTGHLLSERLGKLNWWLAVIGFNLTFMVQHFLGFLGMPRRVATYPDYPWWHLLNLLSTIGSFILALAVLALIGNIAVSLRRGEPAGDNPWRAWTLEWATASPPAVLSFAQVPPVLGRRPLWDLTHPDNPDWQNCAAHERRR
jgi:cytochrome c oxidase subunit 1/cytochrome c oxidase subunit I+III